jgi:RHS repeat-associated protein
VVVERYTYDVYGSMTVMNGSWVTLGGSAYAWNIGHQGGRFEILVGFIHKRNNEYSPTLQTWVTPDDMRFDSGFTNWYAFVGNNPVNALDPWGLDIYLYPGTISQSNKVGSIHLPFGRHYKVVWVDPCYGDMVVFDGNGPSIFKLLAPSAMLLIDYGLEPKMTGPIPVTPQFIAQLQKESVLVNKVEGISHYSELTQLMLSFYMTKQVPVYSSFGPNSNTWARQLLKNAGFSPPTKPEKAVGWDYKGPYGYGGKFFDSHGSPTKMWAKEEQRLIDVETSRMSGMGQYSI